MTIRMTRPNPSGRHRSPGTSAAALRRRAESYRDKADALEAILTDTQEQFTEAFSIADAQVATRDRIASAARKRRNNAGRNLR